jgi:hypothetical protein
LWFLGCAAVLAIAVNVLSATASRVHVCSVCVQHSSASQHVVPAAAACALQEVVTALVRLYQRYTFELQPGQVPLPVKQTFALIPAQGLRVRVQQRK